MPNGAEHPKDTEGQRRKEAIAKCQQYLVQMRENPEGFENFVKHWREFLGVKGNEASPCLLVNGASIVFSQATGRGWIIGITYTDTQERTELNYANNQFIRRDFNDKKEIPTIGLVDTDQAAIFLEEIFSNKPPKTKLKI